jgi:glycosyltransferase involved in cell wall biosynthesis
MLIGIDASRAMSPEPTGTEHYSWWLINGLLSIPGEHRHRLYMRDRPPAGHFHAAPGVEQVVMPFPRLWTHLRLSAEMIARPPDVLFVPAHVLPLAHPRRSVVTVMDLGYLAYPEAHRWADRVYLDQSTRWNVRQARHIIAISGATRDDIVAHYGTDPAKITVIYPGVNEEVVRVEDAGHIQSVRLRYSLPATYLLYVGTLHPRKNLARLVRAFGTVLKTWPSTAGEPSSLVLAGKKGWLYDEIFREVRTLGLEGRVFFPGYVPQGDLPALMSGARAFVYPSFFEGFGFPILEAMACGTPVVCSRASCLPEVAGDAAWLIDPRDEADLARGMERVLSDETLRAELVERGRRRVAGFTWERCARETLAVLERVRAGG